MMRWRRASLFSECEIPCVSFSVNSFSFCFGAWGLACFCAEEEGGLCQQPLFPRAVSDWLTRNHNVPTDNNASLPRQMYQRSGLYLFGRKTAVRLCHALDFFVLFCKEPKEGLRVWEEARSHWTEVPCGCVCRRFGDGVWNP